jgi:hypothetical protein
LPAQVKARSEDLAATGGCAATATGSEGPITSFASDFVIVALAGWRPGRCSSRPPRRRSGRPTRRGSTVAVSVIIRSRALAKPGWQGRLATPDRHQRCRCTRRRARPDRPRVQHDAPPSRGSDPSPPATSITAASRASVAPGRRLRRDGSPDRGESPSEDMTRLPDTDRARPSLGKWGAFEGVARWPWMASGMGTDEARSTSTNWPHHSAQRVVEKVDRSITNSETPAFQREVG